MKATVDEIWGHEQALDSVKGKFVLLRLLPMHLLRELGAHTSLYTFLSFSTSRRHLGGGGTPGQVAS